MHKESASFRAEIKDYEERLAQNPDSPLFARLAEVYLKAGLVDDALHTAQQGVARHPGHIAGLRALAMACHAKGLRDECLDVLGRVVTALPEDVEAQKLLGRLLASSGDKDAAIRALRVALEFSPDDMECRLELDALERSLDAPPANAGFAGDRMDAEFGTFEDEADEAEEIIEDLEILDVDEADLLEPEESEGTAAEPLAADAAQHDPLSTSTLAELYLQQGFVEKALEIYRTLLADDPANIMLRSRIAELQGGVATATAAVAAEAAAPDSAIALLEGWLDNIGRMKGCR